VKGGKSEAPVKFEAALEELEKIVGEMESADLPLEKLIERYEQGMKLVKICGDKLADAEQKIEILTQNRPVFLKKEAAGESEAAQSSENEASLF
jgi:exodeoxyribonuclease VII small subunit